MAEYIIEGLYQERNHKEYMTGLVRSELIRCKDCKHNYANMIPADPECCLHVDLPITDDFYCARGERWEDNENAE